MKEAEITIKNKLGMHARAASLFVKILMLAAPLGATLTLRTNGEGEEECLAALTELVNNRFGEE